MNYFEPPFTPSHGSQPLSVATEQPVRRRAARCSQPAAQREAIATLLPEVRRRIALFERSGSFIFRKVHYQQLEASLLELDHQFEMQEGPQAGNAEMRDHQP